MDVQYSKKFNAWLARQNDADFDKIYDFVQHLETKGFEGLQGRNKNSNEANTNKRDFLAKAEYANKFHLWHYHIGIPSYIKQNRYKKYEFGDYVSEFIIHYQIVDADTVKLIKLDNHKPFSMPDEAELKERFETLVKSFSLLQEKIKSL
jgi:hypothetical protein